MESKTKYGLMVVLLLMILVLVTSVRFIPMVDANKVGANQTHLMKGKVVEITKDVAKIIINGHEYALKMLPSASTKQFKKEFFPIRAGDVSQEAHNAKNVHEETNK